MSYQVLARKWRPRRFVELVGQEHVVRALSNALDTGRMHHAYLFTGTRGVGKTTIARIFAKSLNCERGQSADPCGECAVCTAVDEGRFVDLLEIDAASNTGVDDVREVIENAQYAPTRGRFKVYLVDEVHMLSKNAFNALLKTLEEPPPHVKFLLATTDPQKLPVTVLSRCLKFNLKRLLPEQIGGQIKRILEAEHIEFDPDAIVELSRAADGSVRDGLSLLDQAIAYGGGKLQASDVRAMLGTVERNQVIGVLRALAAGDGTELMAQADTIASYAPDFGAVLDELAALLHRLQLLQLVPGYRDAADADDTDATQLAAAIGAEDVQIYYQLAIGGRRDLDLAPDARTGFEMTLLRMLAFSPVQDASASPAGKPASRSPVSSTAAPAASVGRGARTTQASQASTRKPEPQAAPLASPQAAPATAATPPVKRAVATNASGIPDWEDLIEVAGLRGPVRALAVHATLQSLQDDVLTLALQPQFSSLAVEPMAGQMQDSLGAALGRRIRLNFVSTRQAIDTPAARAASAREEQQALAERAIDEDPLVQSLKREFDAHVVPQSVRPVNH